MSKDPSLIGDFAEHNRLYDNKEDRFQCNNFCNILRKKLYELTILLLIWHDLCDIRDIGWYLLKM